MNRKPEHTVRNYNLFIGIAAALLFIPFLGSVHLFDWDEINFAESAREMIASGNYLTVQINFEPFWEKPPLFIWMQVLSMKTFGINEFAARFPNAVCGIVSLLVLFNIGRKIRDCRFGLLWVLLYGGSLLPFLYFKSGIIDPWFNLFIFAGIYQIYQYFNRPDQQMIHAAGSGFFIGLAILTKGPVALLIFSLTVLIYLIIKKFRITIRLKDVLTFIFILSITGGMWFILQILKGNYSIIADFIVYQIRLFKTQDAGHGGFLFYHFVVLFFGVFPASIITLPALFPAKFRSIHDHGFYTWMLILFWVVLILFTIVRTKIVHYSSLCYFPLTFLAAWSVYYSEEYSLKWKKVINALIIGTGLAVGIIFILITFIDRYKEFVIRQNWIRDPFAVACLDANGGWKGFEFICGLILVFGLMLFRQNWLRKSYEKAVIRLSIAVAVFTFMAMLFVVGHIESYSQRAAIEFFQSVSNEDAYLETIGYKSYTPLFYGRIREHPDPSAHNKEWLLTGDIDKPAYFALKIHRKNKFMKDYPKARFLYEKNGFAFFLRDDPRVKSTLK